MTFVAECTKCGLKQARQMDGPCTRCGQWCGEAVVLETVGELRKVKRDAPVATARSAVVARTSESTISRAERATMAGMLVLVHAALVYAFHDEAPGDALRTTLVLHLITGLVLLAQMTWSSVIGAVLAGWLVTHPMRVELPGLLMLYPSLVAIPLASALILLVWPFALRKRAFDVVGVLSVGAFVALIGGRLLR